MTTKSPILSVVIPTRNRPESLRRLLASVSAQTLAPTEFEVVVVDDGSQPPLDPIATSNGLPFTVRIVRRDSQPGAHESRCAGAQAAAAPRILFLDDDLTLGPNVLEEHAAVQGGDFGLGPIIYPEKASASLFYRFLSASYQRENDRLIHGPKRFAASELWICNSSGPTGPFIEVLEAVRDLMRGKPISGMGYDEGLLVEQLAKRDLFAQALPNAVVAHVDDKTLKQARGEQRRIGNAITRLLLEEPQLRKVPQYSFIAEQLAGSRGKVRKLNLRLVWVAPGLFRRVSDSFATVADRVAPDWLPPKVCYFCYFPMALAFWEGVQEASPSYSALRAALR